MKVETTAYAPIRLCVDSQREWMATSEVRLLGAEARRNAEEVNEKLPQWAKDNPIQRISKVRIIEDSSK